MTELLLGAAIVIFVVAIFLYLIAWTIKITK